MIYIAEFANGYLFEIKHTPTYANTNKVVDKANKKAESMGTNVRRYHYRQNNRNFNGNFESKRNKVRELKIARKITNIEQINNKLFYALLIPVRAKKQNIYYPYIYANTGSASTGITSTSNYWVTWSRVV
jgi:hypothetical protein